MELFKKRENEYLKEIDELKEQRRRYVVNFKLFIKID
jgi:hypothetical protein